MKSPTRLLLVCWAVVSCFASSEFSCSNVSDCSCNRFPDHYELLCSKGKEDHYVLSSTIEPNAYIHVLCTPTASESDFDALQGLTVGPVDDVYFRLCPLPATSISELLSTLGIASATTIQFQSHRDLGDTFSGKQLKGLGNVTALLLMNNNLTDLPEDFLEDLPKLTWLDLRDNNVRLPKSFFSPVPDLESLELGNNGLTQLDPPLLSNLANLKLLNLWKNNLQNISRESFSGLKSLEQLDISSNSLVSLPGDIFMDLKNLVKLGLHSNDFTHLPEGLLKECDSLEVFRLHDNHRKLSVPAHLLSNLSELTEVYLMRNGMESIPENIFWESYEITNISLQGNELKELPKMLFRDQKKLEMLDLDENQLESLPDNVFRRLSNLQILKLSYNKIKRITREVFYGANNLKSLELEQNELRFVDSRSLLHLRWLKTARFSHNFVSFLPEPSPSGEAFSYQDPFGSSSPFRNCIDLEYLYLANNSITELYSDWRHTLIRLKTLDLSHNYITGLTGSDFHFIAGNVSVDLRNNNITFVDLGKIEDLAFGQSDESYQVYPKNNVRLLLENNPLDCDCGAYDLLSYLKHELDRKVYHLVTLVAGDLRCNAPPKLRGTKVIEVDPRDLTCSLGSTENCPENCDCAFRRDDLGLIVNCTRSGLTDIPGRLPMVNSTNHTELLLDGNRIRNVPNLTYPGYERVSHLYLSFNKVSFIDTGIFSDKLEVLTLDNNNLTSLSSNVIRFLSESSGIQILTLHNNPWECDCSARDFLDLIQKKFKEIPYLRNVTCFHGSEPLSKLSVSDLCPVSMLIMATCIVAAVFGLLVGSLAFIYYKYCREIKVWLYSHRCCLWFVTEEELDRDKQYDAFVSFSHKDESFVVNTLVPELESGENPFKLCLHYRDWIAGEWIPNQIARSVENSRRTLVVLSPNFLESVWSRMEFRAAHKQALSEGRARVIVVLYGDVGPTEDLDPELRAYVSMNTYVKWGDPWFWGKLKYALPHPPSLVRTNLNFIRKRSIGKEKNHIDDKLELIHTLDPSSSPPLDGASNGTPVQGKRIIQ